MSNKEEIIFEANRLIKSMLLNTNVESFGISHQVLFIEFRNERGEDMLLNVDSDIGLSPSIDINGLNEDEYKLILLSRLNLKRVVDVLCTNSSDMKIYFEGGQVLKISGTPRDESIAEPWQISNQREISKEGGKLVIALTGNGYAIWQ